MSSVSPPSSSMIDSRIGRQKSFTTDTRRKGFISSRLRRQEQIEIQIEGRHQQQSDVSSSDKTPTIKRSQSKSVKTLKFARQSIISKLRTNHESGETDGKIPENNKEDDDDADDDDVMQIDHESPELIPYCNVLPFDVSIFFQLLSKVLANAQTNSAHSHDSTTTRSLLESRILGYLVGQFVQHLIYELGLIDAPYAQWKASVNPRPSTMQEKKRLRAMTSLERVLVTVRHILQVSSHSASSLSSVPRVRVKGLLVAFGPSPSNLKRFYFLTLPQCSPDPKAVPNLALVNEQIAKIEDRLRRMLLQQLISHRSDQAMALAHAGKSQLGGTIGFGSQRNLHFAVQLEVSRSIDSADGMLLPEEESEAIRGFLDQCQSSAAPVPSSATAEAPLRDFSYSSTRFSKISRDFNMYRTTVETTTSCSSTALESRSFRGGTRIGSVHNRRKREKATQRHQFLDIILKDAAVTASLSRSEGGKSHWLMSNRAIKFP